MDMKAAHRAGQIAVGPWGNVHSATLDWCEGNYVHFVYIAETWNSLSNIPFILLAVHGMITVLQEGLPNRARYALTHALIAFIGIGSFVFHATLMWHAQVLLDELPMIYVSFQALYCVLLEGRASSSRTPKIACTLLPALITAIYLAYPYPIFHQVSYAILQLLVTYRLQELRQRLPDGSKLRQDCTHLLKTGAALTVVAFAIWNMDNILCDDITSWRSRVGPIGVISQGHAWWHILVACGSNRMVTAIIGVTNGLKDADSYEVAYRLYFFPYLRRRTSSKEAVKSQ